VNNSLLIFCCFTILSVHSSAFSELPKWTDYINRYDCKHLYADGQNIWIGSNNTGLVKRELANGNEQFFDIDNGYFTDQIVDIEKGFGDTVFVASVNSIGWHANNKWGLIKLPSIKISDITVDMHGHLWIASSEYVMRQSGKDFFPIKSFENLRRDNEFVNDIVSCNSDSTIFLRAGKRIFNYGIQGNFIDTLSIPLGNPIDMIVDHKRQIFIAGTDSVAVYSNGTWIFFSTGSNTLSSGITKFNMSSHGNVWAYGIMDVQVYKNGVWEVQHKYEPGKMRITTLFPTSNDSAWLGASCYLARLTPDSLTEIIPNTPGGNEITLVYADKQGLIWTQAKYDKGITFFRDNRWTYSYKFNPLGSKCKKIFCTREGVYWFLLPNDIYYYKNKINGTIIEQLTGSGFVPSGILNDITEDYAGKIWFATTNGVVQNYGTLFNKANTLFPSENINALLSRKDSSLWIGGNSGTLAFYKDSAWTLKTISNNTHITSLTEDHEGNLWIGTTDDGVICKTDRSEIKYNQNNGLGHNSVNTLICDSKGRVFAGTANGLSVFEKSTWTTYRRPYGISGNYITSLSIDTSGTIWIGTERGVSSLSYNFSSVRNIKKNSSKTIKGYSVFNTFLSKNKRIESPNSTMYMFNGKKLTPIQTLKRGVYIHLH
jgi:ligand-binding sensor domain-containing protein